MPQTVDTITKITADNLSEGFQNSIGKNLFFNDSEIESIVRSEDMNVIGRGAECVVIEPKNHLQRKSLLFGRHPLRKDLVVAIDYKKIEDLDEAKKIFYVQRILSTLFPHNFPKFYTSYGGGINGEKSGTIRQRIISPLMPVDR
jgi:hypothetical protein